MTPAASRDAAGDTLGRLAARGVGALPDLAPKRPSRFEPLLGEFGARARDPVAGGDAISVVAPDLGEQQSPAASDAERRARGDWAAADEVAVRSRVERDDASRHIPAGPSVEVPGHTVPTPPPPTAPEFAASRPVAPVFRAEATVEQAPPTVERSDGAGRAERREADPSERAMPGARSRGREAGEAPHARRGVAPAAGIPQPFIDALPETGLRREAFDELERPAARPLLAPAGVRSAPDASVAPDGTTGPAEPAEHSDGERVIRVSIGRVEVRPPPAPVRDVPEPAPPRSTLTLDEYLEQRKGTWR